MRIIAGALGGRTFDSPGGHRTHPMSDRVRGGLFNALGDIEGLRVLDAFAGSGALGFEAVSRGAAQVVAVESDVTAHTTINRNARALELTPPRYKAIRAYVRSWLNRQPPAVAFDVVLCDPPYDDLQETDIEKLLRVVVADGVLALSWPGKYEEPRLAGAELVHQKQYGDAQLIFYRPAGSPH